MIPLKVTTEYSLLQSLIKVPDLIKFLNANNIKTCAICDDELFGVMEFYLSCLDNHIKPIIGLEVTIEENKYFIYAKNYQGYQKLLKINTLKFNKELTFNDLEDANIFIIVPYTLINNYDKFNNKNNIYIGYQNLNEKKNALLLTNNVLYVNVIRSFTKNDLKYLIYLQQLGGNFKYTENDYFNIDIDVDDEKRLNDFCDLINIEIPFNHRYIPTFKENVSSNNYLKNLALKGLDKRLHNNVPVSYHKRLEEELKVIRDMGFTDYFLIVYDYVFFAKKNGILVGPGRGSAAGSLVSYAIGITDIDPIRYDLLFARFLNPYRKKMPDIDIDFADNHREEVINYVKERYGKDKVAVGITFNSLKSKLVIRDMARVLKINSNLLEKFIKVIDGNKDLSQNKQNSVVQKYLQLYPEISNLYDICMHLENLKKNASTHAAGVVVSSVSLDEVIPIYRENNVVKTGIAMEYLEKLGLLKMDFLALRNLSLIDSIIKKIPGFKLNDIPLDDNKVYELFKTADTDDIFQFESNYAKNNLRKLKVSSFEELAIATALVRPGPSNQIDEYIKNKENKNLEIHPALKDILQSTKGIIIFQEQVMKILEVIGGYSPYEADNVRNAISKKKEDIILSEEKKFISSALKKGYKPDFVQDLFLKIKKFAEYGFNKAHSVSYALVAYELAYLKVNYPIEFRVSILENAKDFNTKKRLLNELKTLGIKILKPNINVSSMHYQYKNNYLLLPFNTVKNININVIKEIMAKRNKGFHDIYDFFLKCQSILNEKVYQTLVQSGLLDIFKYNHHTLIENADTLFNYALLGDVTAEKPLLKIYEEYDLNTLNSEEKECYGFYLGNHPCSIYQNVIKAIDTQKYLFKNINLALLIEKISKIKTKKGEDMAFITASDETGTLELTLFPEVLKNAPNLQINDIILVNGKSSKRFDKYQIIVNKIERK